jgi:hypothetical protein
MENHDYTEIYEIGGSIIQAHIENLIQDEINKARKLSSNRIMSCIQYLKSLSDCEFGYIYTEMSSTLDEFQEEFENRDEFVENFKDKDIDINETECDSNVFENELENAYSHFDYVYAFISDISLLHRCIEISMIQLNYMIIALMYYEHNTYIAFDIESCKLMYKHKFDLRSLLFIAQQVRNYESMKFIISKMNIMDIHRVLVTDEYRYVGLIKILIIDRIYSMNDNLLKSMYNLTYINDYPNINDINGIIHNCYVIIKYKTIKEGKQIINNLNNIALRNKYNELLAFHFRPRGTYTKSAVTF